MAHRIHGFLVFTSICLFFHCTGSTESDPPTEVKVENTFSKIPLDGGDTVMQVSLFGITVGDESFGDLANGEDTPFREFKEEGKYIVSIERAELVIKVCGTFCAEGSIEIPSIDDFEITINKQEQNTLTLNSDNLDVADWVAGTRVKAVNDYPVFDEDATTSLESMTFYGLTIGDVTIDVLGPQDESDDIFTDAFGPNVSVTVDSILVEGILCWMGSCEPRATTLTPTDTAYISLNQYVKNTFVLDPAFIQQTGWLPENP